MGFDIIINVVARTAVKKRLCGSAILENDTVKECKSRLTSEDGDRKEQSDSERVNAILRDGVRCFGERIKKFQRDVRIEHKSLILAQDERWRRA